MRAADYHPESGFGVVPDPLQPGRWQVRWWDGQTGESRYCIAMIDGRKTAEWMRDDLAKDSK